MPTAPLETNKTAPLLETKLPLGHGWRPIMLQDKILMTEQSVIWQLKCSHDLKHSTLVLIGLDTLLERSDPISWLLMSSPSTYMIVPTMFFLIALVADKYVCIF